MGTGVRLVLAALLVLPVLTTASAVLLTSAFLVEFLAQGRWRPLTAITSDPVVRVLASRGARLIRNKAGVTPLDLASGTGGGGRGGRGRGGAPRRESTLAILKQYYPEAAKTN